MPDTTTMTDPVAEVMERVKSLTHSQRIALAKRLLDSLDLPEAPPATRGRPVEELIGLGAPVPPPSTDGRPGLSGEDIRRIFGAGRPAPDDETVRRWRDEHLMEKYGQ